MTIVIAQKFGERLIILSDTMISDSATEKPLIIPGRLKAIVLNDQMSIAYAGHANQCHDVVIHCYDIARRKGTVEEVLDLLRVSTTPNDHGVEMEFILAAHNPNAHLYVIKNGSVGEGDGPSFLGNATTADQVLNGQTSAQYLQPDYSELNLDPEYGGLEEIILTQNFCKLFEHGPRVKDGIGGLPVNLLGSPYGHTYNVMAFAMVTEMFLSANPIFASVIADQNARRPTGEREWKFQTLSPGTRGVPAFGVHFEQLEMGFIYLPTISETAFRISNVDCVTLAETLEWRAKALTVEK